ncbi:hypothetical protein AB0L53_28375, partial [Nonomuraea sp. NPDC052129]
MTTVRVRLTLIYSGLFLLTSTVLLITVNLLLSQALYRGISRIQGAPGAPPAPPPTQPAPLPPGRPPPGGHVIHYHGGGSP